MPAAVVASSDGAIAVATARTTVLFVNIQPPTFGIEPAPADAPEPEGAAFPAACKRSG